MLHRITPVLRPVELGRQAFGSPAHIEANNPPVRTSELNLRLRTWQPTPDKTEP